MGIYQKIWKIANNLPVEVKEINIDTELTLEELITSKIEIINENWLLIGRQVLTAFNKYIDLLAIDSNGNLIIIELKRDKTPRDVVAQAIDYASWVKDIGIEKIVEIYQNFINKYIKDKLTLEQAFQNKFNLSLESETINTSHQIVIVASEMDSSTERIVKYLSDSAIPINVIFFKIFQENDITFISRAWFIEQSETEENVVKVASKEPWNGEYYVSFGEGNSRSWDDALKYGFISAGGGSWYSQTLSYLKPGDRLWVNIPAIGYVGVGKVTESVERADRVLFDADGKQKTIYDLPNNGNYHSDFKDDDDKAEYLVKVKWLKAVPKKEAIKEIGFFGNQNSVCRPTTYKWKHTIDRLKEEWHVE